jgi:hypothetical protein
VSAGPVVFPLPTRTYVPRRLDTGWYYSAAYRSQIQPAGIRTAVTAAALNLRR